MYVYIVYTIFRAKSVEQEFYGKKISDEKFVLVGILVRYVIYLVS